MTLSIGETLHQWKINFHLIQHHLSYLVGRSATFTKHIEVGIHTKTKNKWVVSVVAWSALYAAHGERKTQLHVEFYIRRTCAE